MLGKDMSNPAVMIAMSGRDMSNPTIVPAMPYLAYQSESVSGLGGTLATTTMNSAAMSGRDTATTTINSAAMLDTLPSGSGRDMANPTIVPAIQSVPNLAYQSESMSGLSLGGTLGGTLGTMPATTMNNAAMSPSIVSSFATAIGSPFVGATSASSLILDVSNKMSDVGRKMSESVTEQHMCIVCRRISIALVCYSHHCARHQSICIRCVLTRISTCLIGVRQIPMPDFKYGTMYELVPKSGTVDSACPICRRGAMDFMGTSLQVYTPRIYNKIRAALSIQIQHLSNDLSLCVAAHKSTDSTTTTTTTTTKDMITDVLKHTTIGETKTATSRDHIDDVLQEYQSAVHEDCCPYCLIKNPNTDELILNHIFMCPQRKFTCPFSDCGDEFSWSVSDDRDAVGVSSMATQHLTTFDKVSTDWWKILNSAFTYHIHTGCKHQSTCTKPNCNQSRILARLPVLLHHEKSHRLVDQIVSQKIKKIQSGIVQLEQVIRNMAMHEITSMSNLQTTRIFKTLSPDSSVRIRPEFSQFIEAEFQGSIERLEKSMMVRKYKDLRKSAKTKTNHVSQSEPVVITTPMSLRYSMTRPDALRMINTFWRDMVNQPSSLINVYTERPLWGFYYIKGISRSPVRVVSLWHQLPSTMMRYFSPAITKDDPTQQIPSSCTAAYVHRYSNLLLTSLPSCLFVAISCASTKNENSKLWQVIDRSPPIERYTSVTQLIVEYADPSVYAFLTVGIGCGDHDNHSLVLFQSVDPDMLVRVPFWSYEHCQIISRLPLDLAPAFHDPVGYEALRKTIRFHGLGRRVSQDEDENHSNATDR